LSQRPIVVGSPIGLAIFGPWGPIRNGEKKLGQKTRPDLAKPESRAESYNPYRCKANMLRWVLSLMLSISIGRCAKLIQVPLTQSAAQSHALVKRSIGSSQLVDVVIPGPPYQDLGYLGAVSIGEPPQDFLLSKCLQSRVC
jgi:hypothetical protein